MAQEEGENLDRPLSLRHSTHHGLCWLRHWVGLSPRVEAQTDPAVESGKGRGRGSREELTRTSCSLPPEQLEGLNPSTPFISPVVPLSLFNTNQGSVKGSHRSLFLALLTLFLPRAAVCGGSASRSG